MKIRDSYSGWVAKLSLLRQVRVEHPNNFLFARIFSRVSGVQWGLKFRTFKYRTHLKSESFNVLIWSGSVFEWSVPWSIAMEPTIENQTFQNCNFSLGHFIYVGYRMNE